jgi:hypothetical protein
MKRILTSKAYALIVCALIAAAFGVGSAMAATAEPKEAKLTAHVERPDGFSWEGRSDAPD